MDTKTYKERAREKFEQFEKDYDYDKLNEFRWEQKFLLEEEFKDIDIKETRRRNDVLKMINDLEGRIRIGKTTRKVDSNCPIMTCDILGIASKEIGHAEYINGEEYFLIDKSNLIENTDGKGGIINYVLNSKE